MPLKKNKNNAGSDFEKARPTESPGMRRTPHHARGQQTIENIRRATLNEIQSGGLGNLSTTRIAKAAGLSPGGLYGYFTNKEAIIYSIIEDWIRKFTRSIDDIHPRKTGCKSLFEYISDLQRAVLPIFTDEPGIHPILPLLFSNPDLSDLDKVHSADHAQLIADAIVFLHPNVPNIEAIAMAKTWTIIATAVLSESLSGDPKQAHYFEKNLMISIYALASHLVISADTTRHG